MSPVEATLDPYTAILELSERELELAGMGRIDDMHALGEEWRALVAQLPARPPRRPARYWSEPPSPTSAPTSSCCACARPCSATSAQQPEPAAPRTDTPVRIVGWRVGSIATLDALCVSGSGKLAAGVGD